MTELEVDPKTGFTKTLNRMGGMTPRLDEYSQAFVAWSPHAPGPVLDVGAAFGVATHAALAAGARVIANDLEPKHLEILKDRTPANQRARLTLAPGRFPDDLALADGSLGGALLARMLHFLDGDAIERSAELLARWLAPGGKVFAVAVTPWIFKLQPFQPIYEARRAAGERWPGLVDDVRRYDPEGADGLPPWMNFLEPETLSACFTRHGFAIEVATTFSRPEFVGPLKLDGRELVAFVARKP